MAGGAWVPDGHGALCQRWAAYLWISVVHIGIAQYIFLLFGVFYYMQLDLILIDM